jgi:hypothetical protein
MARTALRVLALATALLFGADLLLRLIPAGPDVPTPPRLAEWVEFDRWIARTKLGPFDLGEPRLAAATCTQDGRQAVLTYESPITSERSTVIVEAGRGADEPSPPGDTVPQVTAPTDPLWCDRVAGPFPQPSAPPL